MIELAEIFRDRREHCNSSLNDVQIRAFNDIRACRTSEMDSGVVYSCPNCSSSHFTWKSCGNRHCPKCGNDKITKWLGKRQAEILPVGGYLKMELIGFIRKTKIFWLRA
jgi:predicted RNA-binding Zn-ribbon protein involved in translation (DUF1610 family)